MRSFKDADGRDWSIAVNVTTIERLRSRLQVDLLSLCDDNCKLLAQLADDPVLLVNSLYVICEDQAQARSVSDEDFGRAMFGDVIGSAHEVLMAEIVDFFHDPRKRKILADLLAKR